MPPPPAPSLSVTSCMTSLPTSVPSRQILDQSAIISAHLGGVTMALCVGECMFVCMCLFNVISLSVSFFFAFLLITFFIFFFQFSCV